MLNATLTGEVQVKTTEMLLYSQESGLKKKKKKKQTISSADEGTEQQELVGIAAGSANTAFGKQFDG